VSIFFSMIFQMMLMILKMLISMNSLRMNFFPLRLWNLNCLWRSFWPGFRNLPSKNCSLKKPMTCFALMAVQISWFREQPTESIHELQNLQLNEYSCCYCCCHSFCSCCCCWSWHCFRYSRCYDHYSHCCYGLNCYLHHNCRC
jgi:hypothetical protein